MMSRHSSMKGDTAAACSRERQRAELDSKSKNRELRLVLPTDRRFVAPALEILKEFCQQGCSFDQQQLRRVRVALEEALVNAIIHGNLDVSSKLRDLDDGSYEKLIALRIEKAPYRNRRVEIIVDYTSEQATFTIRDEGSGFDVTAIPDPTCEEFASRPHGRGLFLMRSFMDSVTYNAVGNEVTLVKRKQAVGNSTESVHDLPKAAKESP